VLPSFGNPAENIFGLHIASDCHFLSRKINLM
jgi:hypothetical protein